MLATVQGLELDQGHLEHTKSLNNSFSNLGSAKKHRKMQIPQRAIPASAAVTADDKFVQGIVNLDVYSVYTKNPESLLLKTSPSCSSLASLASLNTSSQQQQQQAVAIEPPSSSTITTSNTSTATASPLISSGIIDMSQFKVCLSTIAPPF